MPGERKRAPSLMATWVFWQKAANSLFWTPRTGLLTIHSPVPAASGTGPRLIRVPSSQTQPLTCLQGGGETCPRREGGHGKGRSWGARGTRTSLTLCSYSWGLLETSETPGSTSKPVNIVNRYISGWKGRTLPSTLPPTPPALTSCSPCSLPCPCSPTSVSSSPLPELPFPNCL